MKFTVLNSRQVKDVLSLMIRQFCSALEGDYAFLEDNERHVYIIGKEVSALDLSKFRINSVGLYIAERMDDGLRLSIEGSQLVGPNATRNVLELSEQQMMSWLKGSSIPVDTDLKGFVILRHEQSYLGCGKIKNNEVLSFVSKARRLNIT